MTALLTLVFPSISLATNSKLIFTHLALNPHISSKFPITNISIAIAAKNDAYDDVNEVSLICTPLLLNMAYGPPSYQAAAYRQLWIIIGPYIHSEDLYAASLVCRQWHQIFSSYLWGNPGSHFGSDNDTVYLSLTRFKRLLSRARIEVRNLVHTLHIPPAQPELYDGPQPGWLRDLLDRLPSLQSLIVSNLSFFDHQSLQVLHQNGARYGLKLLDASRCENTTASSLAIGLPHFPELIYLDLSGAQGTRSPAVLGLIGTFSELCVLKLRDCGLRDLDVEYLTFSNQLRSLDVSNNLLTKEGISKLLEQLPAGPVYHSRLSPLVRRYSGVPLPVRVVDGGVDRFVEKRLTNNVDGHLQIDEGLPSSFSHLYIASNYSTIDSLSKLLESHRNLQHLDCGSINLSQDPIEALSPRSPDSASRRFSEAPMAEVLSPAVFVHAFRNLRSLRIHHSVVTANPFSGKELSTSEQCFELHSEDLRYELDSAEVFRPGTFFELDGREISPVPEYSEQAESLEESHTFNSPEDIRALNPTSPTSIEGGPDRLPNLEQNSTTHQSSFSAAYSQSVLSRNFAEDPISISVPLGPPVYRNRYSQGPTPFQELSHHPTHTNTRELISEINLRRQRIAARERNPRRFAPSMLPNLKTLMLTDIPPTTRDKNVTDSLAMFIRECAEEEELARLEVRLQYEEAKQLPPPSSQQTTLKLQRLVLEISSTEPARKRFSMTKSSTEDPDSELFMQESEQDFSFFGEDDGGLLVSKGRIDAPRRADGGLIFRGADEGCMLDVVGELVSFRREKKRGFEATQRLGKRTGVEEVLCGHWRGDIKVLRG